MDEMMLQNKYQRIVDATQKYVSSAGFTDVVLGLSGGLDSACVAAIAVDAFGSEHVHGVLMPGPYSTPHSIEDAEETVKLLGIQAHTITITRSFDVLTQEIEESTGSAVEGLARENIQARIRGVLLMTLSNMNGWLVLATGNKSEILAGYSTLYGDTVGGFAPLADTYKSHLYDLARWRNEQSAVIPRSSIEKEPSAELRDAQVDSDTLPPYEILDKILTLYVDEGLQLAAIVDLGFDKKTVGETISRVDGSAFKRLQLPPGPSAVT